MTAGPRLFRSSECDEYYFHEGCHILERLNDPADPDVSIARARVPPGVITHPHVLRGTSERYLVLSGEGRARVNGTTFSLGPGDVLVIPPETVQSITNSGADDLVFLAICTPRFRPENYREVDDLDPA